MTLFAVVATSARRRCLVSFVAYFARKASSGHVLVGNSSPRSLVWSLVCPLAARVRTNRVSGACGESVGSCGVVQGGGGLHAGWRHWLVDRVLAARDGCLNNNTT